MRWIEVSPWRYYGEAHDQEYCDHSEADGYSVTLFAGKDYGHAEREIIAADVGDVSQATALVLALRAQYEIVPDSVHWL